MGRPGLPTPGAAMRYQHAAADRDTEIAKRLSELVIGPRNPSSMTTTRSLNTSVKSGVGPTWTTRSDATDAASYRRFLARAFTHKR